MKFNGCPTLLCFSKFFSLKVINFFKHNILFTDRFKYFDLFVKSQVVTILPISMRALLMTFVYSFLISH